LAGAIEQYFQNLKGLLFDPDAHAALAKSARLEINFEDAKRYYGD
jgi:hypothetical protein